MMATNTVGKAYYDKHPEAKWYDYKEESEEPKAPIERSVGLKVVQRP